MRRREFITFLGGVSVAIAWPVAASADPGGIRRIGVLMNISEIEHAITSFARNPDRGMILTPTGEARGHRETIIALAARLKLPAVYPYRYYVADGGLISYGPDVVDQCRLAAGYVDRVLRGEKAGDLPVQAATKYELAINLKTARALGLSIPPNVLAIADEVIE